MLISVKTIPFRTALRYGPGILYRQFVRSILKAAGGGCVFRKYLSTVLSVPGYDSNFFHCVCTLGMIAPNSEENMQLVKRTVTDVRATGGHMRMPGTYNASCCDGRS